MWDRVDYEHQKKINLENLEQKQAMEKNIFTMAREVDRLRGELVTMERKLHGAYTGWLVYGASVFNMLKICSSVLWHSSNILIFLAQNGGTVPPRTQSSTPEAGKYETNSYGGQQVCNSSVLHHFIKCNLSWYRTITMLIIVFRDNWETLRNKKMEVSLSERHKVVWMLW